MNLNAAPITRRRHLALAMVLLSGPGGLCSAPTEAGLEVQLPVQDARDGSEPDLPPGLIPLPPNSVTPLPIPPLPPGAVENSLGMRFLPAASVQVSIWLTRVKDFEVFATESGRESAAWKGPGYQQGADHPVVNVTWNDAVSFCKWLTDRERKKGILGDKEIYRLPTDEEWSVAVGLPAEKGETPEERDLGIPGVYPWGEQWPPPPRVGNYTGEETGADVRLAGYDDQYSWTSPVGAFPANALGLYDMGGNVWQWCMDSWNHVSGTKVLRGASWHKSALKLGLLSSCRIHARPDSSTEYYGFRIVRAEEKHDGGKRSSRRKR